MINYDSDGDRIFSSSDGEMDNIDRIQAKMQSVSIGEFAKFVDFVNNKFKLLYEHLNQLEAELVQFEDNNQSDKSLIGIAHNNLIKTLVNHEFNSHVQKLQRVNNLRNCEIDTDILLPFEPTED